MKTQKQIEEMYIFNLNYMKKFWDKWVNEKDVTALQIFTQLEEKCHTIAEILEYPVAKSMQDIYDKMR